MSSDTVGYRAQLERELIAGENYLTLVVQSTDLSITSFGFVSPAVQGVIDQNARTIAVQVPGGTSVTNLVPQIVHTGMSINPGSGLAQDFTNAVTYTVTGADGSSRVYTVTVSVEPLATMLAASWATNVSGGIGGYTPTQSVTQDTTTKSLLITYNNNGPNPGGGVPTQTWTFEATAAKSETLSFDWHYTGFHGYAGPNYSLEFYVDSTFYPLYSGTSSGLFVSESSSLFSANVTTGQVYGFRIIGSNGDSNSTLNGQLHIYTSALTNLALAATVAVSSSEDPMLYPTSAINDGVTSGDYWGSESGTVTPDGSYWAFVSPTSQWASLDFGQVKTIAAVKIFWEAAATTYNLEYSADGITWLVVGSTRTAGANFSEEKIGGLQVSARYIRVNCFGTKGTAGVALRELQVFGY